MDNSFTRFNRNKHIYTNDEQIDELLKDILRFFNGTPVQPLPPDEKFVGAGCYALYYTGKTNPEYNILYELNRTEYRIPIYVGKAVPSGWRQSRISESSDGAELYNRLRDHYKSISNSCNLDISNFACRFTIFEGKSVGMIASVEAKLIETYMPLWNSCIDGFGNHDPGSGRYAQAVSEWDSLHQGRPWVKKLTGDKPNRDLIIIKIEEYLEELKRRFK